MGWIYTAGIWLYCDYSFGYILCCVCFNLSCGYFILFCNVCVCVCGWVGFLMCVFVWVL
jgi:hypothetical protein